MPGTWRLALRAAERKRRVTLWATDICGRRLCRSSEEITRIAILLTSRRATAGARRAFHGTLDTGCCISHHPTAEARHMAARTSLRLLAVLNVLSSTPARAKRLAPFFSARLAPSPDGPLTHFASPRGEKCRLGFPGPPLVPEPGAPPGEGQAFVELSSPGAALRPHRALRSANRDTSERRCR